MCTTKKKQAKKTSKNTKTSKIKKISQKVDDNFEVPQPHTLRDAKHLGVRYGKKLD